MPSRPKPFAIGDVRIRAIRGPHKSSADLWYFRAELYEAGASRTLWTGWSTKPDAIARISGMVARGEHLTEQGPSDQPPETVHELLQDWMEAIDGRDDLRDSSKTLYRARARRLAGIVGGVRLNAFDAATTQYYLKTSKLAQATRYDDAHMLGFAWRWAQQQPWGGHLRAFPSMRRPRKREYVRSRYTPTEDDAARFLEAVKTVFADRSAFSWAHDFCTMLFTYGCRPGELQTLQWSAVDLKAGTLTLEHKMKARKLPLVPHLVPMLQRRQKPTGLVFHDACVSGFGHDVTVVFRAACEETGIPYFTPTGFRRMMSDRLINANTPITVYQSWMGHSAQIALKHYARARPSDLATLVSDLGMGIPKRQVLRLAETPNDD